MQKAYFKANFGNLEISSNELGINEIKFVSFYKKSEFKDENLELCLYELDEYFKGNLRNFSVKLNISGTEFEKKVYNALLEIPYSKTKTYKEIAEAIGHPKAYRAVGNANAKNKIPIVIPCHRVVAVNSIGGYSSGTKIKKILLNLELSF
ncbi:MAG: methylated-DNA--[protein]-cysteine S-methyltransferase [Campylobacteraceae bacterium]|nr:methylated-DNA--[protein]-cysteine S-methyltransferase [Campylobacteraceae bacterium]